MLKTLKLLLTIVVVLSLSGCCIQHEWSEATCSAPATCQKCGKTKGDLLSHTWQEATCTSPKTCQACGETEGLANGHQFSAATCTEPKICKVCGTTEGEALVHSYPSDSNDFICSRCGEEKVFSYSDMDLVFGEIDSNYRAFKDTYLGKTMMMEIRVSEVRNGNLLDYGLVAMRNLLDENGQLTDISVYITYKPTKDNGCVQSVGNYDYLTVKATLDEVMRGFFSGQYVITFKNTEFVCDGWGKNT